MIRFSSVCFQYGAQTILSELSFSAEPGSCTVLAGPNGVGKSTALALAAGVLRPKSGAVQCTGTVGYAPQEGGLFADLSARDNLRFFAALRRAAVPKAPFLSLADAGRKRVGALSGGMQKRVSLVCAALGSPDNLLLDEPCTGLDVAAQRLLAEEIQKWKQQGRCILYSGHNAAELEAVCDQLVLLGDGTYRVLHRSEISDFAALLQSWVNA